MSVFDTDYYPPLGATSPIAKVTKDYVLGYGLDESDLEMYSSLVETDILCFANYFLEQVIIIKKVDLVDETLDLSKMFKIFGWKFDDVIVEENLEANIDTCFVGMDIIRM